MTELLIITACWFAVAGLYYHLMAAEREHTRKQRQDEDKSDE